MPTYARIADGIVAELFTPPDGVPLADCFVAAVAQSFVVVPAGVTPEQGWTFGGAAFAAPVIPPPPPPTPDQILAGKVAAGIAITCTSNPALDAVYALDDLSTAQVFQIGLYANQFGVFPSGGTTLPYPDITGAPHVFTVPQFVAFLRAVAPLVSALETQCGVLEHGGPAAWPMQTAAIA